MATKRCKISNNDCSQKLLFSQPRNSDPNGVIFGFSQSSAREEDYATTNLELLVIQHPKWVFMPPSSFRGDILKIDTWHEKFPDFLAGMFEVLIKTRLYNLLIILEP